MTTSPTNRNTMRHPRTALTLAATWFITCVVTANLATTHLGIVHIGLGLAVTAGTFAAGLALTARDVVQDSGGRRAVYALIIAGAGISAAFGGGRIALASAVAFLVSEFADTAVYTPLRNRGWARAVIASNIVGAVLDTILFLTVAGFPITGGVVAGQLLVKLAVTLLLVAAVTTTRALLREPLDATGA